MLFIVLLIAVNAGVGVLAIWTSVGLLKGLDKQKGRIWKSVAVVVCALLGCLCFILAFALGQCALSAPR